MASVIVLGSCNTDLVLNTPTLPHCGQTVLGNNYFQAPGGKGANQAVAAARSGANVIFIGAVGSDQFGKNAIAGIQTEGIDTKFIRQIDDQHSGVAMIMVDSKGQNLIGVAPGANNCVDEQFVESLPGDLFVKGNIFVAQWETPRPAVSETLRRACEAGATTILNPAPVDTKYDIKHGLQHVQILVVNEPEAFALIDYHNATTIDLESADHASRLLNHLQTLGPASIVLTMGEKGLWLSAGNRQLKIPAHSVPAVDTVGAGDTFVGALAAQLVKGKNLENAAQWANAAAAISVTTPGAQPSIPSHQSVERFLVSSRGEDLLI